MTPDTAALRTLADRADDDSSAPVVTLDTATVRALCDAADEVERLRAEVTDLRADLALTSRAEAAKVRTAHAALVADLRALTQHLRDLAKDERAQRDEDGFSRALAYDGAAERLSETLDRHAPEETT